MNTEQGSAEFTSPGISRHRLGSEIRRLREGASLRLEDCQAGPDGQMMLTEVFGYWLAPGRDTADLIHVEGYLVPAARLVAASQQRARITGNLVRAAIIACPCTRPDACPAYDGTVLRQAIEPAARQPAPATRQHLNLLPALAGDQP
jgi:hypothetical protein